MTNKTPRKTVGAPVRSHVKSATKAKDKPFRTPDDWQGNMIQAVREIISDALPDAVEERKWKKPSNGMQGVPVWSLNGIICTGETYKDKVKLTFAKGASLADPKKIFNASLEGNMRRAIDIFEGDKINKAALKALLREAAACNSKKSAPKQKKLKT